MPKPLPIMRLQSEGQAIDLAYALYEIGVRFSHYDDPDLGVERAAGGSRAGDLMWIDSLTTMDGAPGGGDEEQWFEGRTPVNSVEQFVAYVETLRREGCAPDPAD